MTPEERAHDVWKVLGGPYEEVVAVVAAAIREAVSALEAENAAWQDRRR